VEYAELIGHYLAGEEEIFIGKLGRRYGVMKLLDGIEKPEQTKDYISITAGDRSHFEFGGKKIRAGRQSSVAMDEATININIEQTINHLDELEKIVRDQPEDKLSKVAKNKALEIIHDALKDVAKRQLTEAAKKDNGIRQGSSTYDN